jgi:predicted nucleotidyltransferase
METKEDILDFLRINREYFQHQYHVTRLGLFGSFIRNEQNENSDIDIIVELDADPLDVHKLKNGLREFIADRFHRQIDIAREKYLKPYAREHILHEAVYV